LSHDRTVLDEAKEIIYGDREKTYGHPNKNLKKIAALWTAYLDGKQVVTPQDVCMMMVLLKAARHANFYKRDNLVDISGYAALGSRVEEESG
jgi:hypothetical protein